MEQKEKELQPQTRAYTVEEIAAILHIGRSSAYIDKYAHLYVLQDEMTEYLRARRLSQAEIEKLYAVENFYEYIQNYLLHHKDVFNYPYQKCADSILYPED